MPPLRLEDNFHSSQSNTWKCSFFKKNKIMSQIMTLRKTSVAEGNFPFSIDKVSQGDKAG